MHWRWIFALTTLAGGTCLAQPSIQLKVVKNSPFSATAVNQSTQELADGNRIIHQTIAFIVRDSEGRTRRDQSSPTLNVSAVYIQDPVMAVVYILDPQSRTARKIGIAMRAGTGDSPSTASLAFTAANGRGAVGNVRSESLGIQVMEGFVVQGTRFIGVLATGQTGNERPLEIVSEAWYSEELQTLIMSKNLDPRVGETTFKLTDIQRAEPSHALFEIPGDYTIRDEPPGPDSRSARNSKD